MAVLSKFFRLPTDVKVTLITIIIVFRKKAAKTSKKVNLVEDSSMLNEVSRLEEVDEEEDAQNEDANISHTFGKQKAIDEAAASKEATGDSSSIYRGKECRTRQRKL